MKVYNHKYRQTFIPHALSETVPTKWDYSESKTIEKYRMSDLGFVMLRCARTESDNEMWQESYKCIRKWYPNKIIIIDDHSTINCTTSFDLENCEIINSEFEAGKSELLPYYYFYKCKWFNRMIYIQDATFIRNYIDFANNKEPVQFLWSFPIKNNDTTNHLIKHLKGADYIEKWYWDSTNWKGCFGLMTIMNWEFLQKLVETVDLFALLPYINGRPDRYALEKLFGCLCVLISPELYRVKPILGNIVSQFNKDQTFSKYKQGYYFDSIVKVWCGR